MTNPFEHIHKHVYPYYPEVHKREINKSGEHEVILSTWLRIKRRAKWYDVLHQVNAISINSAEHATIQAYQNLTTNIYRTQHLYKITRGHNRNPISPTQISEQQRLTNGLNLIQKIS